MRLTVRRIYGGDNAPPCVICLTIKITSHRETHFEQYFGVSITVPDKVSVSDNDVITYVYSIIKGIEYRRNWKSFDVELELSAASRKNIADMQNVELGVWLDRNATAEIFDATIRFSVRRFYPCVRVNDLAKLKEKARILEDGDKIKISFLPGSHTENTDFIDSIVENAEPLLYTAQITDSAT